MNEAIRQGFHLLAAPGQTIELRALGGSIASGYFDDHDELGRVASILIPMDITGYTSPSTRSALLSSRESQPGKDPAHPDRCHHGRYRYHPRRWFPIDIDPVRPSGISSSEEEHQAALGLAEKIAVFLL